MHHIELDPFWVIIYLAAFAAFFFLATWLGYRRAWREYQKALDAQTRRFSDLAFVYHGILLERPDVRPVVDRLQKQVLAIRKAERPPGSTAAPPA